MKIKITNQYSESYFEGKKKEVLNFLRTEAREKRRSSRLAKRLPDSVHKINRDLHPSELVTMASFKLEQYGLEKLLELLNDYGVEKYEVAE